jgi:Flp pilus assembly protein TadD
MRAMIALLAALLLTAQTPTVAPDDLLARGRDNYRAGRYAEAITDLRAAADAILSPAQMQIYVNTGKFDSLPKFETAIVYLAMAYAKLGRDAEAREQIQRLVVAEGIAPTYANLPLGSDIADFEDAARRISPAFALPANLALASLRTGPPTSGAPPPPAAVATVPQPLPQTQPSALTAEQRRALEERIAAARAEAEREAEERIAADRAAIRKQMEERIAAERAAAEREAAERIASERAAIERRTLEQIAQMRAAAAQEVSRTTVATLRRAEGMALAGDIQEANSMYLRLMNAPDASRELIAAAAAGLYRTGDYVDALRAFQRLGTFARGEEDLRYYKAVALFETGRYAEAKTELACALPFIQMTDEINRYRQKIEQMP